MTQKLTEKMNIIINTPKYIALFLIRIYQKLFSFDHSFWARPSVYRVCIYHPSCSEYTYQSIDRFGVVRGSILGLWRIIRCNPFSHPGEDLVPKTFTFKKQNSL